MLNYFQNLFTSEGVLLNYLDTLYFPHLNPSDKDFLTKTFSSLDIKNIVWKLSAWRAPRLDEFPIGFYKNHWDLTEEYIIAIVQNFFSRHLSINHINLTDLVFISKSKYPQTLADFKLIGLCNTIYKVISKAISDRLNKILPKIVAENQEAFLKKQEV